ncbi:MAG TPA: EVE domain-containing protein [Saprospiraceae bacterium]|nr:EVE domain-containing protein [Saprospiraceae bacterium]
MEKNAGKSYWLVKSEPDVFSYDQLVKDGKTRWDGVRNYQARNNLRAMQVGDFCLFYHSNIGLEVVGIARVQHAHYPDPTAEKGDWSCVDLEPYKAFKRPVPLTEIKSNPDLQNIALVRNGRLSVMPLAFDEFSTLLQLGDTQL